MLEVATAVACHDGDFDGVRVLHQLTCLCPDTDAPFDTAIVVHANEPTGPITARNRRRFIVNVGDGGAVCPRDVIHCAVVSVTV